MKNMWNERFSAQEYIYGTQPNDFFASMLVNEVPGSILLPAEGEGRNALFALQQGWQVSAVDYSDAGRAKAERLAGEHGYTLSYTVGDLSVWEPDLQVDLIALIYAHFPPETRFAIHKKLINCLKPGGKIILEAFRKEQLNNNSGGPKNPDWLYSARMLEQDFNALASLHIEELTIHLDEGGFHSGKAEVVRMIARK